MCENHRSNMTRISVVFTLLCVLCNIMSSFAFVFEDCGSEIGKVNEIWISTCEVSNKKCLLTRGKDIHVKVKFTPNKDILNMKVYAFGMLLDELIPFSIENFNACKHPESGIKCPLKKNQETHYKATFTVEKKIPSLSVDVIWEFKNEKNEKIMCVKFPAKIM